MQPKHKRTITDADEVIRRYYEDQSPSEAEGFHDMTELAAPTSKRKADDRDTSSTELNAGDIDASPQDMDVGTEAPGGSNPTPDQNVVDEIGTAVGITYQGNEPLFVGKKEEQRDSERWELNHASADDYQERMTEEAAVRKIGRQAITSKKQSRTRSNTSSTQEDSMPEQQTKRRAQKAKQEGKAATTQAGAFVAEEMRHKKRGKHPVKSRKQAIAIGLSKARRSGVDVPKRTTKSTRASRKTKRPRNSRKTTD